MCKVNLSQEERNVIYLEELKKAQKEKLENISEEERRKIFEEESKIKVVELDNSKILLSFEKRNKIACFIISAIIFILLTWRSFIFGFLISMVGYLILGLVWDNYGCDILIVECPYCGEVIRIKMTNKIKEDKNLEFPYIHYLYVKSNAQGEMNCTKCKRVYEFRYTFL